MAATWMASPTNDCKSVGVSPRFGEMRPRIIHNFRDLWTFFHVVVSSVSWTFRRRLSWSSRVTSLREAATRPGLFTTNSRIDEGSRRSWRPGQRKQSPLCAQMNWLQTPLPVSNRYWLASSRENSASTCPAHLSRAAEVHAASSAGSPEVGPKLARASSGPLSPRSFCLAVSGSAHRGSR